MSSRWGVFARELILAVVLIVVPLQASADWKQDYQDGVEAIQKGDWEVAAVLMQSAISESPQEQQRVRLYGMIPEPYVPHYYLGLALFQQGDCEAALREWSTSESQGAIQKLGQYEDLEAKKGICQQRAQAARLAAAVKDAEAEIASASEVSEIVDRLAQDPQLQTVWAQEPQLGGQADEARGLLQSARSQLATGKGEEDLSAVEEAAEQAAAARQSFEAVQSQASRRRVALQQARREEEERREAQEAARRRRLQREIEGQLQAARSVLQQAASEPGSEGLQGEVEALGRLVEQAQGVDYVAAEPPRLEQIRDRIRGSTASLEASLGRLRKARAAQAAEPATDTSPTAAKAPVTGAGEKGDGQPPQRLREAVAAFFRGDYEQVMEILSEVRFSDSRARAQAHLFRAAAGYSLYLLSNSEQEDLRRQAVADTRACRRLHPGLSPDPRAFSPRFERFYAGSDSE